MTSRCTHLIRLGNKLTNADSDSEIETITRRFETLRQLSLSGEKSSSVEGTSKDVARAFAANLLDVPFASLYFTSTDGLQALRSELTGVSDGAEFFPAAISLEDSDCQLWPLETVLRNPRVVEINLASKDIRISSTISPDEFVVDAFVLPIAPKVRHVVSGFLIAGVNPHHVLDKSYRTFFSLAANLIGSAFAKVKDYEEERLQLLESERKARRRAEESSRLKDEFLSTLSHELRTPLNAINGWVLLLRGGKLGPAQARRALETIERSAKSQKHVINDLLDVSNIITGKILLDITRVPLGRVIETAIDALRPAAEAKGIQLNVQLDSSIGSIPGDAERLQQVVWNVLSNAVKFTSIGGHVDVLLGRTGSGVEISVRDDGQGIGPDFLPHVFDRFTQEDSGTTRQHPGLGLGLAIVRHLVELHGGTVCAESRGENLGATFTITLSQDRSALQSSQQKWTA